MVATEFVFQQIHIDAARNATDDFNPFHDPVKWHRIRGNPFGGPIVLGFQVAALAAHRLELQRAGDIEQGLLDPRRPRFCNYQFNFVDALRPGEVCTVDVRKTLVRTEPDLLLSNRLILKRQDRAVMTGSQRESDQPLHLPQADFSSFGDLDVAPDRSLVGNQGYFLKRKFMSTGHGKNFLAGSLVDQHAYFDELEDRVRFPALFPVALLSCALLEQAQKAGYDFEAEPLVYTRHAFSIDRELLAGLKSNDRLHLLVSYPLSTDVDEGGRGQRVHHCFGLLEGNRVLFGGEVGLVLLRERIA